MDPFLEGVHGIHIVVAVLVVFWFGIGGARDLKRMFARLNTLKRDPADDGDLRTDRAQE